MEKQLLESAVNLFEIRRFRLSCGRGHEITAQMKKYGVLEPLPIAKTARDFLYPLDTSILGFQHAVVCFQANGIENAPEKSTNHFSLCPAEVLRNMKTIKGNERFCIREIILYRINKGIPRPCKMFCVNGISN